MVELSWWYGGGFVVTMLITMALVAKNGADILEIPGVGFLVGVVWPVVAPLALFWILGLTFKRLFGPEPVSPATRRRTTA